MENKEYNLVTLEELEALYAKGTTETLPTTLASMHTLLEQHLYAERLLNKDCHIVDWTEECSSLNSFFTLAYLWMNPLTWRDPSLEQDLLIDGRIAKEVFVGERFDQITELVDYIYEQIILSYADNPTVFKEDVMDADIAKGMHDWSPLTWDVKSFIDMILAGQDVNEKEINKTFYNIKRLRKNLTRIAELRSPKQAAKLLRTLQREWSKIKEWETGFHYMDEEDIKKFEKQLFNNFKDLLCEWDGVTNSESIANSFLAITDEITYEMCAKEVIQIITEARSKSDACRKLTSRENSKFFNFKDMGNEEKAQAVNLWVLRTNKDWVFKADDFRKA